MKTYAPRPRDLERRWYVIDASGAVLGRLASEVAKILKGKHKPIYAPHADTGDHVIVVNAGAVRVTGGKEDTKVAYRHSGYPGGITGTVYARLLAEKPTVAVEKAIRGMLPKNRLGRAMARKLQVYRGPTHPHQAQQPQTIRLGEVPRWDGLPGPEQKASVAAGGPFSRARASSASSGARPSTGRDGKGAVGRSATAKRATAKRTTAKRTTATKGGAGRSGTKTGPARPRTAKRSAAKPPAAKGGSTARRTGKSSTGSGDAKRSNAKDSKMKDEEE